MILRTRESRIERAVVQAARDAGWVVFKIHGDNQRGAPDRVFLGPDGRHLFVEFKAPGLQPRKLQDFIHSQLKQKGHAVVIIDSIEAGKALFASA